MASISTDSNGRRTIQFVDIDRKRRSIRLGNVSTKVAQTVCTRVEELLAAKLTGTPIDRDLAKWLVDIDGTLRDKLAKVGLTKEATQRVKLAAFLEDYVKSRRDLKPATLIVLGHTKRCLLQFFGADKLLRDITPGDAERWRVWLGTESNARDKDRDDLSSNTINRRCGIAKQFFRAAQRRGLIEANPFTDLSAAVRGNRARQYFVSRAEIDAVMQQAPDIEWQLIIALSRFGGLRLPSELLALRWDDVDLPAGRMVIHASKTAHHESSGIRTCPIFPELRPYLEAAWDAAPPRTEFVINRYRSSTVNMRTHFQRLLKRAGITPWPKLFHNMRASRQTELLDHFPIKAVCEWLGNSSPVALEHYAQVTAEHFQLALQTISEPKAIVKAVQNPVQLSAETARIDSKCEKSAQQKTPVFPGFSLSFDTLQVKGMGGTGLEPVTPTV